MSRSNVELQPLRLGRCASQAAWEEASAAVAAPYAELEAALTHEPVVNADETGHRTNGDKRWLWTFVAHTFVVYRIATSRSAEVLRAVLGETFAGILGSDRLSTYLTYGAAQRQLCWSHLIRNLRSALDLATTPSAKRFCREALVLSRRLFRLWHRYRGDPTARGAPLTRAELVAKALPIEKAFFRLGERSLDAPSADVRNLAYALFMCSAGTSLRSCMKRASSPQTIYPMPPAAFETECRVPDYAASRESDAVVRGGSLVCGLTRVGIITDLPRRRARGPRVGSGQGEGHGLWCAPKRTLFTRAACRHAGRCCVVSVDS